MRILYVIHQFLPEFATGTERVTMNVAKAQQRNGHAVEVLTCSILGPGSWPKMEGGFRMAVADGIPVYAFSNNLLAPLAEFGVDDSTRVRAAVESFLDLHQPDVVHVMHSMRMLSVIDVLRERGIPYVVTLTDYFVGCYRIVLKRRDDSLCGGPDQGRACAMHCVDNVISPELLAIREHRIAEFLDGASGVVACSPFVATVVRDAFPDLPVRVIGHGIDLLRFERGRRKRRDGPIAFGYIGTLSEAKGVHILMEAFSRAAPANARLEIVGSAYHNHGYAERLKRLATDRIAFRGAVPHADIAAVLAGFDVLCVPSTWPETFSLALREGFAAGVPALVSDIGAPGEAVSRSGCGRTVPVGDIDAWTRAIAEIAGEPAQLDAWRAKVPLDLRIEEEGFFYDRLYRQAAYEAASA